ncbi:hypothetical protein QBC42DRAFT_30671 [Cladorrhinum samala]|uniref:Uncharacterized protein n=1 Tax=Cladorrhinum samala TaxID=585594 RepID=A0AAV9HDE0_9PEZI|nr:hypothetical protein QBC42DRAFT_30671 [Cladorrhinum samala]
MDEKMHLFIYFGLVVQMISTRISVHWAQFWQGVTLKSRSFPWIVVWGGCRDAILLGRFNFTDLAKRSFAYLSAFFFFFFFFRLFCLFFFSLASRSSREIVGRVTS